VGGRQLEGCQRQLCSRKGRCCMSIVLSCVRYAWHVWMASEFAVRKRVTSLSETEELLVVNNVAPCGKALADLWGPSCRGLLYWVAAEYSHVGSCASAVERIANA
jgi:hypothetical protein